MTDQKRTCRGARTALPGNNDWLDALIRKGAKYTYTETDLKARAGYVRLMEKLEAGGVIDQKPKRYEVYKRIAGEAAKGYG